MSRFIFLFVVAAAALSSSCATMFNGSKETIYVRSEVPGTRFFANERELGTGTSAVVTLSKKELGRTVLRAEKEGHHTKSMPIATEFDGTTLLGILIDWGIFSIVCIDWLGTGAVRKAAQTDYVLTPEPILATP